jgi:putative transposase
MSVYRLLKAQGLITSPAYIVMKAANEFKNIEGERHWFE